MAAPIRTRPCLETPKSLGSIKKLSAAELLDSQFMPKLDEHFCFTPSEIEAAKKPDKRQQAHHKYIGGESVAEDRLDAFLGTKRMADYRQGGKDYKKHVICANSSHLGPWIACGALSLRKVYNEIVEYER